MASPVVGRPHAVRDGRQISQVPPYGGGLAGLGPACGGVGLRPAAAPHRRALGSEATALGRPCAARARRAAPCVCLGNGSLRSTGDGALALVSAAGCVVAHAVRGRGKPRALPAGCLPVPPPPRWARMAAMAGAHTGGWRDRNRASASSRGPGLSRRRNRLGDAPPLAQSTLHVEKVGRPVRREVTCRDIDGGSARVCSQHRVREGVCVVVRGVRAVGWAGAGLLVVRPAGARTGARDVASCTHGASQAVARLRVWIALTHRSGL